jgi:hypothetical protein
MVYVTRSRNSHAWAPLRQKNCLIVLTNIFLVGNTTSNFKTFNESLRFATVLLYAFQKSVQWATVSRDCAPASIGGLVRTFCLFFSLGRMGGGKNPPSPNSHAHPANTLWQRVCTSSLGNKGSCNWLYKSQSRQSAKLFLQSSELGLPQPLARRRVCRAPPPFWFRGRGTLAGERGGGRVPVPTRRHTLW